MHTLETLAEVEAFVAAPFSVLIAKSHTCATCQQITAHLNAKIPELNTVPTAQVFLEDFEAFRGHYVVFSVPTVLVFSDGKERLRESRFIRTDVIRRALLAYQESQ
ncbi:MAG: thioredoxin [Acholeplasmatales bacterium]|nr:MAG: thioredoxin [Acholeplasmatales bacterium]